MGYSIWEYFTNLINEYNKTKKTDLDGEEDLDAFIVAYKNSSERKRKDFIGVLVSAECEATGDSEENVISDVLGRHSNDSIVIIRHDENGFFSMNGWLPSHLSLLVNPQKKE